MTPRMRRLFFSAGVLALAIVITALFAIGKEAPSAPTITDFILPAHPASGNRALAPATAFTQIAQRPLFLPSRRPEPQIPAPSAAPETHVQPPAPPSFSATLVGVLMSPAGGGAILRFADGKTTTIQEGETVQGWILKEVSPDRASFLSGSTSVEVAFPKHQASPTEASAGSPVPVRRRR